ncbi:hypothetical protein CsSME_00022597 [Camellia sinensis var. sinensis]
MNSIQIIVNAGNGSGGFFTWDVLDKLGADTFGSLNLKPDGMFPNHIPNPEDKTAMSLTTSAVLSNSADLGIVFDTDVDRSGVVDKEGNPINGDKLIALMAAIVLREHPGTTIVTDARTSMALTRFITERGGRHCLYRVGYRNVIDKGVQLNLDGVEAHLMMETSGHGALKENHFLDDGKKEEDEDVACKKVEVACKEVEVEEEDVASEKAELDGQGDIVGRTAGKMEDRPNIILEVVLNNDKPGDVCIEPDMSGFRLEELSKGTIDGAGTSKHTNRQQEGNRDIRGIRREKESSFRWKSRLKGMLFRGSFQRGALLHGAVATISTSISLTNNSVSQIKMLKEAHDTIQVGKALGLNFGGYEAELVNKIVQMEEEDEIRVAGVHEVDGA